MSDSGPSNADTASNDINELRGEIAELRKELSEFAELQKEALADMIAARARRLRRSIEHAESVAEASTGTFGDEIRALFWDQFEFVGRRPVKSLLIASGIGVLFGMVCGRRR